MQPTLEQVSHYFRNALDDELHIYTEYKDNQSVCLSPTELENGEITSKEIRKLAPKGNTSATSFQIVIAPVCYQKIESQKGATNAPEKIVPLMVPCWFNTKNNRLTAIERVTPWFVREHLEPQITDHPYILGEVGDAQKILAKNKRDFHTLPWSIFYEYFFSAIEEFTPHLKNEKLTINGVEYAFSYLPVAYQYESKQFITQHLKKSYDNLKEDSDLPLFETFLSGASTQRPLLSLTQEIHAAAQMHTAQMSNAFGLGKSQRQTIHHYFACQHGELLAVNGPPGTGKTTLLQSAIASEWVNAIIEQPCGKTIPPIIVATSSNNQAVTNVIRDFGSVLENETDNLLAKRWLPEEVHSLGAYHVSTMRPSGEQGDAYLQISMAWNGRSTALDGFFTKLESVEFAEQAYESLLTSYETFSNQKLSDKSQIANLKIIQAQLREQLIKTVTAMGDQISLWEKAHCSLLMCHEIRDFLRSADETATSYKKAVHAHFESLEEATQEHAITREKRQLAMTASSKEPFWFALAPLLPFLKVKRKAYATAFVLKHDIKLNIRPNKIDEVCEILTQQFMQTEEKVGQADREFAGSQKLLNEIQQELSSKADELEKLEKIISKVINQFEELGLSEGFTKEDLYPLLTHFDRTNRYTAFLLAVHYYEALWLEKVLTDLEAERTKELGTIERLRRISMLTPCIVSTLFMTPKLMAERGRPIFEGIDLLILDEAGQASIDKAAAVFPFAKKALVVGDVYQIEPVVSIPAHVDFGNMSRFGLYNEDDPATLGHLAIAESNAMLLAQRATPYQCIVDGEPVKERGMHLLEHRRCPETVINYCKELAYPNLEVLTKDHPAGSTLYPHLGYAHIPSFSERKDGSRYNDYEAANIVKWLEDNRTKILQHYGVSNLAEIIAIVTPFKKQASVLRSHLRKLLPANDANALVVGTVHKMQGAEKQIILFSPVYGMNDGSLTFIDQKINMLNVAVSRAKDSFLVFGNLEIFNGKSTKPSGILAKHLRFETGENELKDFKLLGRNLPATIEHLTKLEEHQKVLKDCFNVARKELIIVSPYITLNALRHDNICGAIKETTRRGVPVKIYTDAACVNFVNQSSQRTLDQITELLKSSGATLHFGHGLHNKTIKVDDHTIIEGSFNWLSANRGKFAKLEHSIVYRGKGVKEFGRKIEESLTKQTNSI